MRCSETGLRASATLWVSVASASGSGAAFAAADVAEQVLQLAGHLFHARRRHDLDANRCGFHFQLDFLVVQVAIAKLVAEFLARGIVICPATYIAGALAFYGPVTSIEIQRFIDKHVPGGRGREKPLTRRTQSV